jgi:hypothetical protein
MSDREKDTPGDPMERVSFGAESAHLAFQRHMDRLLADANISDEDRQRILTNTVCPCCGGGASLTVKLGD